MPKLTPEIAREIWDEYMDNLTPEQFVEDITKAAPYLEVSPTCLEDDPTLRGRLGRRIKERNQRRKA